MAEDAGTSTYLIPEGFRQAVKSLRSVLSDAGLKVTGELDLSGRLQRRLLVETPPCLVLFAGPAKAAFRTPGGPPGAAALTPLHIVIAARGEQTEIHVLNVPLEMAELGQFRGRLVQAIEKVGMRCALGA